MNADRIAEIRGRLNKATPGPWGTMHARPDDKKMSAIWAGSMASGTLAYVGAEWTDAVADAELIAHAPDDLAFLLDLVAPVPSGEVETPGFCTLLGQTCSHPDCDEGRNCPKRLAESYNDSTSHAYLERKVQQLAGEVETPCATCGGTKRKRVTVSENPRIPSKYRPCPDCGVETPCATCGGSRLVNSLTYAPGYDQTGYTIKACPDCGVETPEAAVEACARALWEAEGAHITPWPGKDGEEMDIYYDDARTVIQSLLAQGWTPPGGTE